MTLVNLIVQPQYAYLVTDSAVYDGDDGTVRGLLSKSTANPELRFAYAIVGKFRDRQRLDREIASRSDRTSDDLLNELPELFRDCVAGSKLRGSLVYAGYSSKRRRAFGGVIAAEGQGIAPYELVPCDYVLHPPIKNFDPSGLTLPGSFYPFSDSMGLVECQRHCRAFGTAADRLFYGVGGDIEVVSVGAAGILRATIGSLPVTVGERIDPRLPQKIGEHLPALGDSALQAGSGGAETERHVVSDKSVLAAVRS